MKNRIGFYPGSFDPITIGHLEVIEKSALLVDKLFIGIGINPNKKPFIDNDLREKIIVESTRDIALRTGCDIECLQFSGLTIVEAGALQATTIFRGLRDNTDFDYEMQMVGMNASLAPSIQTVFIPSSSGLRHISATHIRQIHLMGGDISAFVPTPVVEALRQ